LLSRNYTDMDLLGHAETLSRWIHWVVDRVRDEAMYGYLNPATCPDYFGIAPESAASKAVGEIHDVGDHRELPMEIRLMIFGHWLKDNQPPWDITKEMRIPDWVTPTYEEVWFRNTEFLLPAPPPYDEYVPYPSILAPLEGNAVRFIERLCRRQSAHPVRVTVEVAVDACGNFGLSNYALQRLLLVRYHLGTRKRVLKIRVVVDTRTHRGRIPANASITKPILKRIRQDCTKMKEFVEGSTSLGQIVSDLAGRITVRFDQSHRPECVVAAILSEQTAWGGEVEDIHLLGLKCRQLINYLENEEKARVKEEEESKTDISSRGGRRVRDRGAL
jgi:hypothetical protein